MKQKLIYILFVFLAAQSTMIGQSQNAYIKAADKAYEQKDFYSALEYYSQALSFDSTRIDLRYDIAQSARQFNSYTVAIREYHKVMVEDTISDYPEASYWLAETLQKIGNYNEAIDKYNLYLSEYGGNNPYLTAKAKNGIISAEWAIKEVENEDTTTKIEHLGSNINTPYSEFGAIPADDGLLFTSMRFKEMKSDHNPPRVVSKILTTNESLEASVLDSEINESEYNVAHTAFNDDKSKVYYTICDYITDSDLKCDIYSRGITEDGSFINPVKLSFNEDHDSITYTQPTVGKNLETGEEFLIFSSNRPGSKGKMDLWKVAIIGDNTFGEIKALDQLNTIEDEITPYYHTESGVLYFSSNGKIGNGGFDVYSSDFLEGDFRGSYNLGRPINSSYNDIYYVIDEDERISHLSSNRTGSYFIDELQEACCYDIYRVEIENNKIDLNTLTFDELTRDSLYGVTVRLIDPESGIVIEEITTMDGIDHNFMLRKGRDYLIVSEKEGWNPDTMTLSSRGTFPDGKIVRKAYLTTDRTLLDITTFEKESLASLPGATIEVIDKENGEIIFLKTNYPGNDFKIYVNPGKTYEVIASKDGYSTETIMVDLTGPQQEQIIKRKIYLSRIDLEDFLPLALYFDNDRPDPKSKDLYSPNSYSDIYDEYLLRKEEFKKMYVSKLRESEKTSAAADIEIFFQDDVVGGYQALIEFMDVLETYLRDGKTANLSIKGYTSPLAASKYNLALGQRRVSTVKNEISRYKGGVFMPFIASGQLSITDVSYGEELAPDKVSDRASDRRNSIYSVEASKERRVEIVRIKIN